MISQDKGVMEFTRLSIMAYDLKTEKYLSAKIIALNSALSISILEKVSDKDNLALCSEVQQDEIEIDDPEIIEHLLQSKIIVELHEGEKFEPLKAFSMPRFDENYLHTVIKSLGGMKIPESSDQTPDYIFDGTLLELKAIEADSLYDKERQSKLGEIFSDSPWDVINLNPIANLGEYSKKYHRLIESSLKYRIKEASKQIKAYKKCNIASSAGAIILNTGMHSLPHDLAIRLLDKILKNDTKTVEFIILISQVWQSNWMDALFVIKNDIIGADNIQARKVLQKFNNTVLETMSDLVRGTYTGQSIRCQSPISFYSNGKLFFWSPGPVPML